ncbi:MAG TPA: hypothetical protein DEB06_02045, partial [Phycisphaerales bacterium]|nr:hypothetical protein [Phycisphaerales bacterium]
GSPPGKQIEAAASSLDAASIRQQQRPDRRAMNAPPPPLLLDQVGGPLTDDALARARLSLAEAVALISAGNPPAAPEPAPGAAGRSPCVAAGRARAYAEGRRLRLAEEFQRAEGELRRAARLDPASAEIWREFGEVQLSLGNLPLALSAFRRAIERQPEDIRSLDVLTRLLVERREDAQAVPLLARLRRADLGAFDAALPIIVSARLGEALARLGYDAAGAEAYAPALDLPERFGATTNFAPELSVVYRQRGEVARAVGDAALRRGVFAEAARAYAIAARVPSADPGALLARRVYSAMRAGQPADAASILIHQLTEPRGVPERDIIALLRSVLEHTESPGPIRESILLRASRAPGPVAAGRCLRALAELSPAEEGIALLADRLARFPGDRRTLVALVSLTAPRGPSAQAALLGPLTTHTPEDARAFATAIAFGAGGPMAALAAWPEAVPSEQGSRLIRAHLLSLAGRHEEAAALLTDAAPLDALGACAAALRAELLIVLGRRDEAAFIAASIDPGAGEPQRLAQALTLSALSEPGAAASAFSPLLHSTEADPQRLGARLALGAALHLSAGDAEAARALALEAMALDPTRESPALTLLRIHLPSGALADDDKFGAVVRTIRDDHPESATMSWLRAADALQRRQFEPADREARAAAEANPERADLLAILLSAWRAGGMLDRGEPWLREHRARWPGPGMLALALAEVLTVRQAAPDAVAVLEAQWDATPGDEGVSRALESALRRTPGSGARADEIAESRLAHAPRTKQNLIDLIQLSIRRGALDQALRWASELSQATGPFDPPTLQRLMETVSNLTSAALTDRAQLPAALAVQRAIVEAAPSIEARAHFAAVELLVASAAPLADILDGLDRAAAHHPEQAIDLYRAAAQALNPRLEQGRRPSAVPRVPDAVSVLEHAAEVLGDPPSMDLITDWALHILVTLPEREDTGSLARLVDLAQRTDLSEALVDSLSVRLTSRGDAEPLPPPEIAYLIAARLAASEAHAQSELMYRLTIRLEPDHILANNNLGYRLLNEDRDTEAAARMIQRAYDAALRDPRVQDKVFVTDSLGWARYKRGVIHDELDADGDVLREGALTLLGRVYQAVRTNPGQTAVAPIIIDHYADALWAAGRREEAIAKWTDALNRARAVIGNSRDPNVRRGDEIIRELTPVVENTQAKIDASSQDAPPPVARMSAPANRPANEPAPEPASDPAMIE